MTRGATVLNRVGERMSDRVGLAHGDELEQDGHRLEVVDVPHPEAHLFVAVEAFGPVAAQQLVSTDKRGRRPWERGHRAGRGGQPVLGPRALWRVHA